MESTTLGNTPSNAGKSNGADAAVIKASSSAHAAVDSMAGAADEAVRKAKPAIDKVTAKAHEAVDRAADAAVPAADWLAEKSESLDATQKKLVADTCSYVAANPLKAIGIAVVAGVVLGRILL
jgi:ElaB/YqjD/DUF883 family membrane-anchored ribosome-binding protein